MGATTTRLMTFAEFEKLPDEVCRRHELRHGELVEVPPAKFKRSFGSRSCECASRLLLAVAADTFPWSSVSARFPTVNIERRT